MRDGVMRWGIRGCFFPHIILLSDRIISANMERKTLLNLETTFTRIHYYGKDHAGLLVIPQET
jgi:hypothetical protein